MTMTMTWNEPTLLNPPNPACCNGTTADELCPKCEALYHRNRQQRTTNVRQPATLNERQQILPRTGPLFPPKETLNVQPRNGPLVTPTINYKKDLEDRLARVRQEAAATTAAPSQVQNSGGPLRSPRIDYKADLEARLASVKS